MPGIIDDHIEAAEFLFGMVDGRIDVIPLADVGGEGARLATERFNFLFTASSLSAFRSTSAISAPSAANRSAMPRPMPSAAPVTRMTFFVQCHELSPRCVVQRPKAPAAAVYGCRLKMGLDIDHVDQLVVDELLEAEAKQFAPVAGTADTAKGQVGLHLGRVVDKDHPCRNALRDLKAVLFVGRKTEPPRPKGESLAMRTASSSSPGAE